MANKVETQQKQAESMKKKHNEDIEAMKKQIASLEGQTLEEQVDRERLAAEKKAAEERLAAEKRFNQLYIEVQGYFEPNEAEVYKKGNQLLIRLRAIHFPIGKYIIMPRNYELLGKVQQAIRNFSDPNVVIEGHTDSTGSDTLNDHLSEQRAEAVREYFVANETLPSDSIVAIGYGSKQPLASNETEEGRAINRRIDVIIRYCQPKT